MKTTTHLRQAVELAGGKLEEDEGRRDMRCFQAVAPDGRIWQGGSVCLRINWARGSSASAIAYNESEYADTVARLSSGLRDQTPEEVELYANN